MICASSDGYSGSEEKHKFLVKIRRLEKQLAEAQAENARMREELADIRKRERMSRNIPENWGFSGKEGGE